MVAFARQTAKNNTDNWYNNNLMAKDMRRGADLARTHPPGFAGWSCPQRFLRISALLDCNFLIRPTPCP
jgi:hypothetical protein